jgi:hypothetical protein
VTPRARQRATAVARKFEQVSKHADALRASLAIGDHPAAWVEAVSLKKSLAAAKHLLEDDRRASRTEEVLAAERPGERWGAPGRR